LRPLFLEPFRRRFAWAKSEAATLLTSEFLLCINCPASDASRFDVVIVFS
jgi:hypothetical protein